MIFDSSGKHRVFYMPKTGKCLDIETYNSFEASVVCWHGLTEGESGLLGSLWIVARAPSHITSHLYNVIDSCRLLQWQRCIGDGRIGEWPLRAWIKRQHSKDRHCAGDKQKKRGRGDWQWCIGNLTIWRNQREHNLHPALSCSISLVPARHSPRLGGRGKVKESVSSIFSQVLGDKPFVKVCHWLWGYLSSLIEDDRSSSSVSVCLCARVPVCKHVREAGIFILSLYIQHPSPTGRVGVTYAGKNLMMWSREHEKEEIDLEMLWLRFNS